jgi:hypothetical protein
MKILYFFLFLWVIFALLDPVPATQTNADPDTDPDPQPHLLEVEMLHKDRVQVCREKAGRQRKENQK